MILHNKYTRLLLLFFCIATTSCSIIPADNPKEVDFELHGHRGARGLAPENTIPAFRKAVLFDVHSLELDIVVSKDSQIVISHEPSFNPVFTTLPNGLPLSTSAAKAYNFYKMNYDEIRRFDVGLRIHPDFPEQETQAVFKPTLKEMVLDIDSFTDSLGKKRVHFILEKGFQIFSSNLYYNEIYALKIRPKVFNCKSLGEVRTYVRHAALG